MWVIRRRARLSVKGSSRPKQVVMRSCGKLDTKHRHVRVVAARSRTKSARLKCCEDHKSKVCSKFSSTKTGPNTHVHNPTESMTCQPMVSVHMPCPKEDVVNRTQCKQKHENTMIMFQEEAPRTWRLPSIPRGWQVLQLLVYSIMNDGCAQTANEQTSVGVRHIKIDIR